MTVPARGDGAAAGARSEADANEPQHSLAPGPSPALLVRVGGRWMCRHELADAHPQDGHAPHVQLRP
jgi:hypothetical protein